MRLRTASHRPEIPDPDSALSKRLAAPTTYDDLGPGQPAASPGPEPEFAGSSIAYTRATRNERLRAAFCLNLDGCVNLAGGEP